MRQLTRQTDIGTPGPFRSHVPTTAGRSQSLVQTGILVIDARAGGERPFRGRRPADRDPWRNRVLARQCRPVGTNTRTEGP